MQFELKVFNDPAVNDRALVDVDALTPAEAKNIAGIIEDDIWSYNELFSKIAADNHKKMEYLASAVITRIEGQTAFYDTVCRFVCIMKLIESGQRNYQFINLDYRMLKGLIRQLNKAQIKYEYDRLGLLACETAKKIKFCLGLSRLVLIRCLLTLAAKALFRKPKDPSFDYAFISFYDYRSQAAGGHQDVYFGPLIKWLEDKKARIIVFNRLLHHNDIPTYLRYVKNILSGTTDYENTIDDRFVGIADILRSAWLGLTRRPTAGGGLVFKGVDISCLTSAALEQEFYGLHWLDSYSWYYFAKNIFRAFSLSSVIYPYENHPWEKLLVRARNESAAHPKLTAFQHTSFSYKLLQHFPGEAERDLPLFPDKILTAGKILKQVLEKRGHYPDGLIAEGCALRHAYLFDQPVKAASREARDKVAYAFSFDLNNYRSIIDRLADIFNGSKSTVYLKFHPLLLNKLKMDKALPPNFLDARDIAWGDIFKEIGLLLYDDNSQGIEALRHDVAVGYFALTGQMYNTDRLFEYKKNKLIIDSPEKIRECFAGRPGIGTQEKAGLREYNELYLREYFSPITEEKLAKFS